MTAKYIFRCLVFLLCIHLFAVACKRGEVPTETSQKPQPVPAAPTPITPSDVTTPTLPSGPALTPYPLPDQQAAPLTSTSLSGVPRRMWNLTKEKQKGDGPCLLVVLPSDEVSYMGGTVRCAGSTTPGSQVTVNDKPLKMFPSGAFVGSVQWTPKPGLNPFVFKSTLNGKTTVSTVNLREAPTSVTQITTGPTLDGFSRTQPESDQELQVGDTLKVRFEGPPGAHAWFKLDKSTVRHEMPESKSRPGMYQAECKILATDRFQATSIQLFIEAGPTNKKLKSANVVLKSTLTTLASAESGRVIRVLQDDTGLFSDTSGDHRITSLHAGTQLFSNGKIGKYYRVPLDKINNGWITEKQCTPLTFTTRNAVPSTLTKIETATDEKGRGSVSFQFRPSDKDGLLTSPPPTYRVDTVDAGTSLTLTLWQADAVESEVAGSGPIRLVRCIPNKAEHTVRCEIYLIPGAAMRGFVPRFANGQLILTLITPRIRPQGSDSLQPLRIVLDAGHGGTDLGAVGPQGVCEADANLVIAYRLAQRLHAHGATVFLTRADDHFVSLEDRIDMINKSDADLFLSIHCDSIGPFEDPIPAFGARAYYYYACTSGLAQSLQTSLMGETGIRGRGQYPGFHYFRPLRRCTQIPGALTEVTFVSNPEDENRLIDPAFLDKVVLGLYKGIENYARR